MESRLRKLLSPKRPSAEDRNAAAELDLHSVPYTTAPAQGKLPVFIHHALGKTATVKARPESTVTSTGVRSLSYDSTVPGKPPQLCDRPQRGNGPVKLQTNQRLSSGELLVTQQDYERTLDDIRQGDYILGGKDRRICQATTARPRTLPVKTVASHSFSSAPSAASRTNPGPASPQWEPPSAMSDDAVFGASSSSAQLFGNDHLYENPSCGSNRSTTGLGISTLAPQFYPRHMASTSSFPEHQEERQPAVQALWRAEYGRLASIYGQAGVNRNIAHVSQDYLNKPLPEIKSDGRVSSVSRKTSYSSSTQSFQNALSPQVGAGSASASAFASPRPGVGIANIMPLPHFEHGYLDDHSERSSTQRHSALSSTGTSSSFTTRTSLAEDPAAPTSRDELRKIVDEMRLTYLHAIEARTPPTPPLFSSASTQNPRSRKQTRSLTSSMSVESGLRSASQRQSKNSRSKSWQSSASMPQTSLASLRSHSLKPPSRRRTATPDGSRRAPDLPVAGFATLPAIQASPARGQNGLATNDSDDKDNDDDDDDDHDEGNQDDCHADFGADDHVQLETEPAENAADVDVGLKRADSTTLGSMAAKLTILDHNRASISSSSQQLPSSVSVSASTSSPTFYISSESEPELEPDSESEFGCDPFVTKTAAATSSSPLKPSSVAVPLSPSSADPSHDRLPEPERAAYPHQKSSNPVEGIHQNPAGLQNKAEASNYIGVAVDLEVDPDLDLALDLDDFESLCNDSFNGPDLRYNASKSGGMGTL
ncbi:hypothetical protein KCU88_g5784, partial [Aureobasidium melanogenum]